MTKKKTILTTMFIIVTTIVGIILLSCYIIGMQRILMEKTYKSLHDISLQYKEVFVTKINEQESIVKTLAAVFATEIPNDDVMRIIKSTADQHNFDKLFIVEKNGMARTNDSEIVDLSDRDYFKRVIGGEVVISEPLPSAFDGQPVMTIAVPIVQGDNVLGAVVAGFKMSEADNVFLSNRYGKDNYGFIISHDGTIILSSKDPDRISDDVNLFGFLEKANYNSNYSYNDLKDAISKGEGSTFSISENQKSRYVDILPLGINGWYACSIATEQAVAFENDKLTSSTVVFAVHLGVLFVIIVVFIFYVKYTSRRVLKSANDKYKLLIKCIKGCVAIAYYTKGSKKMELIEISENFVRLTGYTSKEMKLLFDNDLSRIVKEEDFNKAYSEYVKQVESVGNYQVQFRIVSKSKKVVWVIAAGYVTKNENGRLIDQFILTDITNFVQQDDEIRLNEERLRIATKVSKGCVFEVDINLQKFTYLENSKDLLGLETEEISKETRHFENYTRADYIDAITSYFCHILDKEEVKKALKEITTHREVAFEARVKKKDGTYLWCKVDLAVVKDSMSVPIRVVGIVSSIDEIKKQAELLKLEAQSDCLTGLYNKTASMAIINAVLNDQPRHLHALLILDIDNFKQINDTYGHDIGDIVIKDVGTVLSEMFRSKDVVSRFGGDEFLVFMTHIKDPEIAKKKATEICNEVANLQIKTKLADVCSGVTCSIGISFSNSFDTYDTLFKEADRLLYAAKSDGKNTYKCAAISTATLRDQ